MRLPGVVWVAILALIPHLIEWLGGDYFRGYAWVPVAIILLSALAKILELWVVKDFKMPVAPADLAAGGRRQRPSRLVRWLLG